MHTTELTRGWIAIHNEDYSGDVEFHQGDGDADSLAILPFDVIVELVAEAVRTSAIGHLEDAGVEELIPGLDPLYLHGEPKADEKQVTEPRAEGLANAPRCEYCDMPTVVEGVCRSCGYDVRNVDGGRCVELYDVRPVGAMDARCPNDMLGTSQHCAEHQRRHVAIPDEQNCGSCSLCEEPVEFPIHKRVVEKSEERTPMTMAEGEREGAAGKRQRRQMERRGAS